MHGKVKIFQRAEKSERKKSPPLAISTENKGKQIGVDGVM